MFQSMFARNSKEAQSGTIELELTERQMNLFIQVIYNTLNLKTLELSEETIRNVIEVYKYCTLSGFDSGVQILKSIFHNNIVSFDPSKDDIHTFLLMAKLLWELQCLFLMKEVWTTLIEQVEWILFSVPFIYSPMKLKAEWFQTVENRQENKSLFGWISSFTS